jgi:DNA-binding NarL/FixJ family response regulator
VLSGSTRATFGGGRRQGDKGVTRLQTAVRADAPRHAAATVKIAIVEARPLIRQAVTQILQQEWPDAEVVTVSDGGDLGSLIGADGTGGQHVCLVLLSADGSLAADRRLLSQIEDVSRRTPKAPVVVLADSDAPADVRAAMQRGARGYISTRVELPVLVQSLRLVAVGGTAIPATVLEMAPPTPMAGDAEPKETECRTEGVVVDVFTPKELEVLSCLRAGKPNKIIAYDLNICETTVKVHLRHIMRKLGATNRTHAALLARDLFESAVRE